MGVQPEICYSNNCPACWAPNKTPDTLFISLAGMQPGPNWVPGNLPPPNGIYALPVVFGCLWHLDEPFFFVDYRTNLPGSRMQIKIHGGPSVFFESVPANCVWAFANDPNFVNFDIWDGGNIQISWNG